MRYPRGLARLVVSVAVAAAVACSAGPAAADPPTGPGCVGVPSVPLAYVCLISATPGNAVPSVGTTTTIPVTIPQVCYFLDCIGPLTVNVPVPDVTFTPGTVAVLYWNGSYIPISLWG